MCGRTENTLLDDMEHGHAGCHARLRSSLAMTSLAFRVGCAVAQEPMQAGKHVAIRSNTAEEQAPETRVEEVVS